ncbi:MAG: DNA-3-methyladenine glycosylase [Bdellovibrionales bacterium]
MKSLKFPPEFYQRNTRTVARELLGQRLVRIVNGKRISGIITETEAYMGVKDKAAHSYGGRQTPRVQAMYLEGGHAYIYFIYGMYYCLNVVTQKGGVPEAVLIRSVQIDESIDLALKNRKLKISQIRNLSNGPGKLCLALKIGPKLNGTSLQSSELFIEENKLRAPKIQSTPRIGIAYAEEWVDKPLRFVLSQTVSS